MTDMLQRRRAERSHSSINANPYQGAFDNPADRKTLLRLFRRQRFKQGPFVRWQNGPQPFSNPAHSVKSFAQRKERLSCWAQMEGVQTT